jgi:hypothetical protein
MERQATIAQGRQVSEAKMTEKTRKNSQRGPLELKKGRNRMVPIGTAMPLTKKMTVLSEKGNGQVRVSPEPARVESTG